MDRLPSNSDYEQLLGFRTALRQFLKWSEDQAAAAGLTPAQHQLLLAVRGHPGDAPPTVSDLAGHLMLRHHSVVGLIDRAVAHGLVERVSDTDDGRVAHVRLTRTGARHLARLAAAHLEELRRLSDLGFTTFVLSSERGRF